MKSRPPSFELPTGHPPKPRVGSKAHVCRGRGVRESISVQLCKELDC
jgi:hypothetical protein